MLVLDNIGKSFAGKEIFSSITCTISLKERYALIGRNGSGKSTLMKIIAGIEEPNTGFVKVQKDSTIGYLSQHIKLKDISPLDEVLQACKNLYEYEAKALLFGLGFDEEMLTKKTSEFSGGYQLRIELAKTLGKKPDILLLDEPTNYLDIVSIRFLERFLKKWPGICIITSHDRAFLDAVCTHTMGLYRRQLRRVDGDTSSYYQRIHEEETTKKRENENIRKQKAHLTKFVTRFRYKASKAGQAQSKMKAIEKLGEIENLEDEPELDFTFYEAPFPSKQMLSVHHLCFSFDQEKSLIHKVTFDLQKNEILAIIGKNGSGKSTLLRLLANQLTPDQGHIKQAMNVEMSYFAQTNIQSLIGHYTIYDEIKRSNAKLTEREIRSIAAKMLFPGEDTFKKIEVLSGGERARVLLAKMIANQSNLILLDEPSNHLDIESTEALISAIKSFNGATVIVTHNEWILHSLPVDKILHFSKNKIEYFLGNYELFLQSKTLEEQPKKKITTKDEKAKKAEIVIERSKLLKPIKELCKKIEKQIKAIEKEKQKIEEDLVELYSKQQGDKIAEKLIKKSELEKKLDTLYYELEECLVKEEKVKQSFSI